MFPMVLIWVECLMVAKAFNQDIGNWNVSNVTDMYGMFAYAETFNQDIGSWNVSNVTDMRSMFKGAKAFNQDLNSWDVSKVTTVEDYSGNIVSAMKDMFKDATSLEVIPYWYHE